MAVNVFGVTPAVIAGRLANLTIGTSTPVTQLAVEDMIDEMASVLAREAEAVGISTATLAASGDTEATYNLFRAALIYGVADRLVVARARGTGDIDRPFLRLYEQTIETIRLRPQAVDDTAATNRTYNLAAAAYASETVVPGLAGKIIRGGL
jgi:hypothetical protein